MKINNDLGYEIRTLSNLLKRKMFESAPPPVSQDARLKKVELTPKAIAFHEELKKKIEKIEASAVYREVTFEKA